MFLKNPYKVLGVIRRNLGRLEKHKVVSDVIESLPTRKLYVEFDDCNADFGNVLTPTNTKYPPKCSWTYTPGKFYTLCMVDPDAPSRKDPKFREWQHWLVVNIKDVDVSSGDVLSEYICCAPPKGTGLHRYVLLLYEQPRKMEFTEKRLLMNTGRGRTNFSIAKFAAKYRLGEPIAANFFQAEWDEYVTTVYKQLEEPTIYFKTAL